MKSDNLLPRKQFTSVFQSGFRPAVTEHTGKFNDPITWRTVDGGYCNLGAFAGFIFVHHEMVVRAGRHLWEMGDTKNLMPTSQTREFTSHKTSDLTAYIGINFIKNQHGSRIDLGQNGF